MKLKFYDHSRQRYAKTVPFQPSYAEAVFMIGEYADDGGVNDGGEFEVVLFDFDSRHRHLSIQVQVFDDGLGAFDYAMAAGLRGLMAGHEIISVDEFSRALISIGIEDKSDNPLEDQ